MFCNLSLCLSIFVAGSAAPNLEASALQESQGGDKTCKISPLPPGGTDFLQLSTVAKIEIYGKGMEDLQLDGWYVINRSHPDESGRHIITQILAMDVRGESESFGPISVSVSPTAGAFGAKTATVSSVHKEKGVSFSFEGSCDVMFEMRIHAQNLVLFNKQPVHIIATPNFIPPIGTVGKSQGEGAELYSVADPDGKPLGKLISSRKTVGSYVDLSYRSRALARENAIKARSVSVPGTGSKGIPRRPEK